MLPVDASSFTLCRARGLCALALVALVAATTAAAQTYPAGLIRLVVPNSPGSVQDVVARILAPEMAKSLGQPIVVDNKAGGRGLIGLDYVAKQMPPDGYTLLSVTAANLATLPVTVKDLGFDPLRDLPPVAGLVETRFAFGSAAKEPWKSFRELVAHAKAHPGKLNYGSPAPAVRLPTEAILHGAGIDVVLVPYAGAGPYFQALVAGEVQMGLINEPQAISFGDRFRVLAVTGERRSESFRDVPTFAELGYPQIRGLYYSFNVRAGTPKAIVDRLHAAASQALAQPEVKARFVKLQMEVLNEPPDAAVRRLADEARLFAGIAKTIGFQPD